VEETTPRFYVCVMTTMTTAPSKKISIEFTEEELKFLADSLKYGEEDYERRARITAERYKPDDKRYQAYMKHKLHMFPRMRLKLIEATNKQYKESNDKYVQGLGVSKSKIEKMNDEYRKRQQEKKEKELKEIPPGFHFYHPSPVAFGSLKDLFKGKTSSQLIKDARAEEVKKESMRQVDPAGSGDGGIIKTHLAKQLMKGFPIVPLAYHCGACGRLKTISKTRRRYKSNFCKHPGLKDISKTEIICGACKSWDYDVMVRRRYNRKSLRLKNGKLLTVSEAQQFIV
jgi:hypothetical protein